MRGVAAVALVVSGACALAAAPRLPECDGPAGHRVLSAAPAQPAEAAWLDATRLLWPGRAEGGRFRLVRSAAGIVQAPPGGRVIGADSAQPLQRVAERVAGPRPLAHLGEGPVLEVTVRSREVLRRWHRGMLILVHEDAAGRVLAATAVQAPRALDALYAAAEQVPDLGVGVDRRGTQFKLWAPTAQRVWLCLYPSADGSATRLVPMHRDDRTGVWQARPRSDLSGASYRFLVDVFVRGTGWVRQLVTDPYSVSLSTDSERSYVADLRSPSLAPPGWATHRSPHARAATPTDMVIYELHVRDFSIGDASVPPEQRGKYLAFTQSDSRGMQHLRALAQAGLTDIHLLPVFDLATVPEAGCVTPRIEPAAPDSESQQAQAMAARANDCFNWGYDPFHFNAPEGSYATNAADGAVRIREFRAMVMALHEAGLRVGMDVVYNHTSAAGQKRGSVLDRIVPGYYQRLNATGEVETSTCCDNTATEHRMMGKLMLDSLLLWARHYGIDSFRFDLMGHQPRAAMEEAQALLKRELGRDIHFVGEGWNFGEVADNKRFRQATQRELNGTAIGTFSDRGRDAVRGGAHDDSGDKLLARRGWLHGAPDSADLVRVGLAGTLRDYALTTRSGAVKTLGQIDYAGQGAGYASQPSEVVNYVDNHDNQTLFDINALRLPQDTSREDRARVQILGIAITAFSQGVAYFHAGVDTLRSKSLDRNSYDSGDWFNRLDWSYQDNFFGSGLPPKQDNGSSWAVMAPVLANPLVKPTPAEIAWTRDAFRDLLKIRASSALLRLRTADEVSRRLRFFDTGPGQQPLLMAAHLDGRGLADAGFAELVYFINAATRPATIDDAALRGRAFELHPVHAGGTDHRARESTFDITHGRFVIPPRSAVVFVRR